MLDGEGRHIHYITLFIIAGIIFLLGAFFGIALTLLLLP